MSLRATSSCCPRHPRYHRSTKCSRPTWQAVAQHHRSSPSSKEGREMSWDEVHTHRIIITPTIFSSRPWTHFIKEVCRIHSRPTRKRLKAFINRLGPGYQKKGTTNAYTIQRPLNNHWGKSTWSRSSISWTKVCQTWARCIFNPWQGLLQSTHESLRFELLALSSKIIQWCKLRLCASAVNSHVARIVFSSMSPCSQAKVAGRNRNPKRSRTRPANFWATVQRI